MIDCGCTDSTQGEFIGGFGLFMGFTANHEKKIKLMPALSSNLVCEGDGESCLCTNARTVCELQYVCTLISALLGR